MTAWVILSGVLSTVDGALGFLVWRLICVRRMCASAEWLANFSAEDYRPMERLLSESDFDFLRSQRGFSPQIARKLRAERRKIFRSYLSSLTCDFDRLHQTAKLCLIHSPQDRPELAVQLAKQKLAFGGALALVHIRLALHATGIGSIKLHGMLDSLETMRQQVFSLARAELRTA